MWKLNYIIIKNIICYFYKSANSHYYNYIKNITYLLQYNWEGNLNNNIQIHLRY